MLGNRLVNQTINSLRKERRPGVMKKFVSIVLLIMMLVGTVGTAMAVGADALNDDAVATENEAIRFYKEITVYNPDNATVNEPTATYTYTVTAGSASKTIKDTNSEQTTTKAGVGIGQIKMSSQTSTTAATASSVTLSYAPDSGTTMSASSTGTKNTKWVEIDFSDVVFGAAGVYRYKIAETAAHSDGSNGVVKGTTGTERYLDVYVRDSTVTGEKPEPTTPAYWEIYGYAMFTADEAIDATTDPKETRKTTGFVAHSDGDPNDVSTKKTADAYYTFNLVIQKVVANDSYIKSIHHEFPFTVTLSNETVTAKVLPIMTTTDHATQTALESTGIVIGAATVWSPTIAHEENVTYVGIPAGTTITIKEKNNVSGATYSVSSSGADIELSAANVAYDTESGTATVNIGATAGQAVTTNKTVVFNNNLQQISPTGYVSRYAPYGLILIAGVVLLVIAKKHKKHTDED